MAHIDLHSIMLAGTSSSRLAFARDITGSNQVKWMCLICHECGEINASVDAVHQLALEHEHSATGPQPQSVPASPGGKLYPWVDEG